MLILPSGRSVSSSAFKSLLDNAIEALRKIGDKRKYLELIIEQTKDSYIDIFVKNTIESSVLEKNPQF